MKWFKTPSIDYLAGNTLALIEEGGLEAYGLLHLLMQMVALQFEPGGDPSITVPAGYLSRSLNIHPNKLTKLLGILGVHGGVIVGYEGGTIRVEIPKLLNLLDNYTARCEQTTEQNRLDKNRKTTTTQKPVATAMDESVSESVVVFSLNRKTEPQPQSQPAISDMGIPISSAKNPESVVVFSQAIENQKTLDLNVVAMPGQDLFPQCSPQETQAINVLLASLPPGIGESVRHEIMARFSQPTKISAPVGYAQRLVVSAKDGAFVPAASKKAVETAIAKSALAAKEAKERREQDESEAKFKQENDLLAARMNFLGNEKVDELKANFIDQLRIESNIMHDVFKKSWFEGSLFDGSFHGFLKKELGISQ
ncbi:MAG: hypothetical protein HQL75_00525 [Magnetococcales bacterium]|nr:hypothetical protein [Magnetococcales bacterium]